MSAAENKAVFLSYASQDAAAARRICDSLRSGGVEVWFDADGGLEHGDEWDAKIRRQIKECVLFIPVISASTQARHEGYFRIEWDLAAERARGIASGVPFILPVVIDDTREPDALVPDRFRMVQWTKLRAGEVPPEVQQRFLKLWSHRTGVLKHEAGVPQASPPAVSLDADGKPALPTLNRRVPAAAWIAAVAVTIAFVGFIALRLTPNPGPAPIPKAPQSPPAPAQAAPPISEARKLMLQARTSIDDDWLAVRENFRLADELCERATKLDPTDGEAWATWARVSAQLIERDYDTSNPRRDGTRSRAERAMQLAPDSIEAGLAMALVLAQNGSTTDAAQRLRDLLKRAPMDARVARALATTLSPPGKPANAEATDIRLHHPSFAGRDPRPLFDEARTMHDTRRRLAECEALMARAATLSPCWEGYAWNLGYGIFSSGDLDASEKVAREIPPRLLQEDVFAALIANLWIYRGDGEKARAALARVPRDFIEDRWFFEPTAKLRGDAYVLSGRAAAAAEQWKQALVVVERRLIAEPADQRLQVLKAGLFARLGRRAEARQTWQLASELGRVPYAVTTEAVMHLANGDREDAILCLQRGLSPTRAVTSTSINVVRFNPVFAPIRSDPRVAKILMDGEAMIAKLRQKPDATAEESAAPAKNAPMPDAKSDPADKSVAVLAFADNSPAHDSESFSEGISEELGVVLNKVPGLRVAGWNSTLSFKGKNVSETEIAQKLGVTHIVSGSVRRDGTEVRITARLVNAADGFQLWSDSFKREAKGIFAVQDEIAGLIAEYLKLKLDVDARRTRVVNPEAHRLVLEGRHFWNQRNDDGFARAEVAFLKAIEIDPTFAEAHVGLAGVYVIRGTYQALEDSAREVTEDFRRARTAATKAVELGPDLAEAHAVLAYTLFNQGEKAAAGREFERALALNPNSAATDTWFSVMESLSGHLDAALGSYAKAATLDPLWFINLHLYAEALFFASRYDEALQIAERAAALRSDNFIPNLGLRAQILFALGRRAEAVALARTIRTQLHRDTRWMADAHAIHVLRQCGEVKEAADYAAEVLRQLEAQSPVRAPVFAALGSFAEALPTIGGTRITMRRYLFWEPIWDPWRDDPRFQAALAQLGCTEEYKTARATLARLKTESAVKK